MKKRILFIFLLGIILVLSACVTESSGVPDSVVLRNCDYNVEQCSKYELQHNFDPAAHIDDVELILYYEDTYGTQVKTIPYSYQYDKSSDLWTLISEGNATSMQTANEDAYIKNSPFMGTVPEAGYRYSVIFRSIDMDKMIADIDCFIRFENADIPDIAKSMTVDLYSQSDLSFDVTSEYEIDWGGYTLSEEASIRFQLCIDYGLLTLDQLVSGEY